MATQNERAERVIEKVGHPQERWDSISGHVQSEAIKQFTEVQDSWLKLMWCLDAFRKANTKPADMEIKSVDALNRRKGNWFAELISILLQNRTSQSIRPRTEIQGFSQYHQIDVAWPARKQDPLVCIETKVTGAPAVAVTDPPKPPRNATSDWSNRRKELKFAATDLKLYRRRQGTSIDHWDVWRMGAPPKTYFIWGARLNPGKDDLAKMVAEVRLLTETYLDGAAVIAWQQRTAEDGYDIVPLPRSERVRTVDDTLHRIASEIGQMIDPSGEPPKPVVHESPPTEGD